VEIKVPDLGESITEVEIGTWYKDVGEEIELDDPLVEIESAKAAIDMPAPASGVLGSILKQTGDVAGIGDVIGTIETDQNAKPKAKAKAKAKAKTKTESPPQPDAPTTGQSAVETRAPRIMPSAQKIIEARDLDTKQIRATGPGGRILKEDAMAALETGAPAASTNDGAPKAQPAGAGSRTERVERMSLVRRTIAGRLVQAKQNSALLTTFNEIDMFNVKALRAELKEPFQDKHGVKLGFMSFFVKATIETLKQFPQVNAELRGDDMVFHDYYDIGVAIGGGKGLVVPVLRDADRLSFAQIEAAIADFAGRAKAGTLGIDELEGGTFTVSNGGVYGSMLSTPIINPPQSGILGLHAINDRPVVVDGQITIRPVMYVALTYDHRIIDGREAVTFLKGIKERIENPGRLLLGV
jgi:2-oxoglutarate dehydrogenase E2 component (dihydrolipoamide succinyltransferase)